MKFKVFEDIDAPARIVWPRMTDFSGPESIARGGGAELTRVGNWTAPETGKQWRGSIKIRGRVRPLSSEISEFSVPERVVVDTIIGGMSANYTLTFSALRPDLTRVEAVLDLSANTLSARLSLQALKLARGRVIQRLQGFLARQGNLAEEDFRRENA